MTHTPFERGLSLALSLVAAAVALIGVSLALSVGTASTGTQLALIAAQIVSVIAAGVLLALHSEQAGRPEVEEGR
jgi:hypothetical protein